MIATSRSSYRNHQYFGPRKSRKRVRAQLKRNNGGEVSRVDVWRKKRKIEIPQKEAADSTDIQGLEEQGSAWPESAECGAEEAFEDTSDGEQFEQSPPVASARVLRAWNRPQKSNMYSTLGAIMQQTEREITIQAPWGKLRGLTWGTEGAPPVFLCHGRMDACSGFRPLLRLLPDCFHYVAVDLPGNGKSDHLPRGIQLTAMDYVPTVKVVRDHFKWEKFIYVGHSLGVLLGKYFNIAYPGHITRMVELDPLPAHECCSADPEGVRRWYHLHYSGYYSEEQYKKLNGDGEPPKHSYAKALTMVMEARRLPKEAAEHVVERVLSPTGDGFYRFTHDQRLKTFMRLPLSGEACRAIYTSTHTPTLCILAQGSIDLGLYDITPFVKDPGCWPNGNYRLKIVEGGHDVHISHPAYMAEDISKFLLEDVRKTKL